MQGVPASDWTRVPTAPVQLRSDGGFKTSLRRAGSAPVLRRVVSQAELSEHIYAQDLDRDSNTVEVFVARLRRKLGASLIETVRGLGYRIGADS